MRRASFDHKSAVMAVLLTVLAIFGPGAVVSLALLGRRVEAIPLSALVTALMCSLAGVMSLLAGGSVLLWAALITIAAAIAGVVTLRRGLPAAPGGGYAVAKLAVLAAAALPLAALRRPVIDWDARSIWSFHGRWFYAGGEYLRDALDNPAFAFSHSDYPPAVPATIGVLWRLNGGIDPWIGQVAVGLLNFSAVSLIGLGFVRLGSNRNAGFRSLIGILAALGSFGVATVYGTNGYLDLLWAAGIAAAVTYLLVAPESRTNLVLGLVSLVVSGLVKNEGMVIGLFVLVLAVFRHRARGRRLLPYSASAAAVLIWPLLARTYGASSDLAEGFRQVLAGDINIGPRFLPIAESVGRQALPLLVAAAVCAIGGSLVLPGTRDRMSLGTGLWSWCAIAGCAIFIVAAYVVTPNDLAWHLRTSVERTTIGLQLLALIEVLCWASVSLERLSSPMRSPG